MDASIQDIKSHVLQKNNYTTCILCSKVANHQTNKHTQTKQKYTDRLLDFEKYLRTKCDFLHYVLLRQQQCIFLNT